MFIDMVVMPEVQVSIMEIVGVAVVRYGLMPTGRAVHMTMASVFVAYTFHRINLHCNQIANGVQEDVGMTAQLNPVLVLLIRPFIGLCSALIEKPIRLSQRYVRNITCSAKRVSLRSITVSTIVVTIIAVALVGYHRKTQQKSPSQMIEEARVAAHKNDKFLMVQFGASWCPDCVELSRSLKDVITSNRVEQHFVVVNIDVGEFNRNLNVARSLGVDVSQGIPVAVFFPPHNEISSVKLGTEQILAYIKEVNARP
jgi:thiol-disulfide isomerase/thioredoxin